jgi:hypothetical protein
LKCAGSIFLNGGNPNAALQRDSSGLPGLARTEPPGRALATRAATFRRDALFDFALLALFVTHSLHGSVVGSAT